MTVLTLVIFQGYAVFTRHNSLWSEIDEDWGFKVTTWATTGTLILLFVGCFGHGGKWI
jgi:hypothetical protein